MGATTLYDTITIWVDNAHCEALPTQVVIEVQPRHTITPGRDTTVCAEADVTFIHTLGGGTNVRSLGSAAIMANLIAIVDNDGVVTLPALPCLQGTYIATLTTSGVGTCTVLTIDTIVARYHGSLANQGSNIYCPRDKEPIFLTVTPIGTTRIWTLVNNPNQTTAPTSVIVYPNAYDSSYAGVYFVVVTQDGCIATATVEVLASCSSAPGADTITITQGGVTTYQGTGFGQYALTQTSVNYSDDIQITLEDPRVAKYISDTCGFEYSINGSSWIVWVPTTTPIVIDTTDLTIGENVVLIRHDTTCGEESLIRKYIFTLLGAPDSLAHTPTIVPGEVCHNDLRLFVENISIRGFNAQTNRYEWRYSYRLADTTITSDWEVLLSDSTPAISVNNTPDQEFTTQVGDTVIVSLRVAYVTTVEDTNHEVVDTIWVGTAEVDEIYTIRAIRGSGRYLCMYDTLCRDALILMSTIIAIQWRYRIDDEATYSTINLICGLFHGLQRNLRDGRQCCI